MSLGRHANEKSMSSQTNENIMRASICVFAAAAVFSGTEFIPITLFDTERKMHR